MPTKPVVQYTVRGIPRSVDQVLRKRARELKVSLNQLLVEELTLASGSSPHRRRRSLESLGGQWKDDPEFEKILQEQRQIDMGLWR